MTAQLHVTHPAAHAPDGRAQDQAHPGQPRHRPARTLDTIDAAIAEVRAGRPIIVVDDEDRENCLLYTSPSPRDLSTSRMPSSA